MYFQLGIKYSNVRLVGDITLRSQLPAYQTRHACNHSGIAVKSTTNCFLIGRRDPLGRGTHVQYCTPGQLLEVGEVKGSSGGERVAIVLTHMTGFSNCLLCLWIFVCMLIVHCSCQPESQMKALLVLVGSGCYCDTTCRIAYKYLVG